MTLTSKQLRALGLANVNGVARPVKAPRPGRRKREREAGLIVSGRRTMIAVLPIVVVSEMNTREHWAKRHARKGIQQHAIRAGLAGVDLPALPVRIKLTRLCGRLLDSDNAVMAFKHCRDELARLYGVDDSPRSPITWEYDQRIAPKDGIEVRIETVDSKTA